MLLESPAGFCVHGWDHWHFERSQGDDFCKCSLAKEQTTGEGGMTSVFKELRSRLGRKGMICTESLKILDGVSSHEWHRPLGPGSVCGSYKQGLGSHLGHWGLVSGHVSWGTCSCPLLLTRFPCLVFGPCLHRTLCSCYLQGEQIYPFT